jgi:hypothetical protein
MLSHEGAVRAVERRFETRFEDLRLTLHEFTEGTTGVVRCHAVAERTGSGDAPAPVFDPHEASVLVALVKRGALTARRARS